jgi:glutathione S-transferase
MGDTSLIIEHLVKTRGTDPDAHLDKQQRARALLVQRTLEEHYAFVLLYTHFIREQGWRHTRATFNSVPAVLRPLVARMVRTRVKRILWFQGLSRHSDSESIEFALQDWRGVLGAMSDGPYFLGDKPCGVDAVAFAALAGTILTPIESPSGIIFDCSRLALLTQSACAIASFPNSSMRPRGIRHHHSWLERAQPA